MNVVFVHGILDSGSIFNDMIAFFEAHGITCYAPSLTPSDGRTGLENLASQLKHYIYCEEFDQQITIVSFSMGALIARYYLQELDGF